ncbi:MAG: zinc ribbon domain-containing protein [Planctomycetes bacterium]|nr:zinc ribbon domain-containing protein [Planctomycetota bacterium]
MAGKKVKCRCEAVFRMPPTPDGAGVLERPSPHRSATHDTALAASESEAIGSPQATENLNLDIDEKELNLYDLASADFAAPAAAAAKPVAPKPGACPSCHNPVKPQAVICINCGYNLQSHEVTPTALREEPAPSKLAAAMAKRGKLGQTPEEAEAQVAHARIIDMHLPLCLIFLGVVLRVAEASFFMHLQDGESLAEGFKNIGSHILVEVPVLIIALMVAVRIFGMAFGTLIPAILKTTAIALLPYAVGNIFSYLCGGQHDMAIWFIGMTIASVLYWVMVKVLFELDMGETFTLTTVLYFVQFGTISLVGMLLGAILG